MGFPWREKLIGFHLAAFPRPEKYHQSLTEAGFGDGGRWSLVVAADGLFKLQNFSKPASLGPRLRQCDMKSYRAHHRAEPKSELIDHVLAWKSQKSNAESTAPNVVRGGGAIEHSV